MTTRSTVREADEDLFLFDGKAIDDLKITNWLEWLRSEFSLPPLRIESASNFPIQSGLASSAAAFACLITAIDGAFALSLDLQQKSTWARRGSASAARSIPGGWVTLEPTEVTTICKQLLPPESVDIGVIVAITSTERKHTPSTEGMLHTQHTSPLYDDWIIKTHEDFDNAVSSIRRGDTTTLGAIAESSCKRMHKLMRHADPPLNYWNETTLRCIECVEQLRNKNELNVHFSIDAGPQVKVLSRQSELAEVKQHIESLPGVINSFISGIGGGARLI